MCSRQNNFTCSRLIDTCRSTMRRYCPVNDSMGTRWIWRALLRPLITMTTNQLTFLTVRGSKLQLLIFFFYKEYYNCFYCKLSQEVQCAPIILKTMNHKANNFIIQGTTCFIKHISFHMSKGIYL
jgi:hypothetical protein